ncbi:MAG: hypothetical protein WDO16_13205 [Bacteroidota bacterium]
MLLIFSTCISVLSQNQATIVMQPAATTVSLGQTFNIMVKVDFSTLPATSITDAVEIYLSFDKTKLKVTAIAEQPTVAAFTSKPIPVDNSSQYSATNTAGQVSYAAATTSSFPTADFNVLQITFEAIAVTVQRRH